MRFLLFCLFAVVSITVQAQADSTDFHAYLSNQEYKVYLKIDFHRQSIEIPGQELLGPLPGYLGKEHNSFCWPIITADIHGKKAYLEMVNDYGSEDLEATLTRQNDSIYVLKQGKGSTLKVPNNGKWQKLPSMLYFKRE